MGKIPKDLMDKLAGKPNTERTQKEHRDNTDITRLREYEDKAKDTFSIRINADDKERLQIYFENRGLKLTQGIRMIIKEYMEREGI